MIQDDDHCISIFAHNLTNTLINVALQMNLIEEECIYLFNHGFRAKGGRLVLLVEWVWMRCPV